MSLPPALRIQPRITKPFPLSALLILYCNSSYSDTYIDHMEGLKELILWLGPVFSVSEEYTIKRIPRLHGNYELNTLANLVSLHPSIVYQEYEAIKWLLT